MRWGWAGLWLASVVWAGEPLAVRDGLLVGAASGREACLVGTSYSPAFGMGFRNLLDAGGDAHRVVGDDLAAVRLMGLDCVRVLVDDAELMLANGSLADNAHLELLDFLLAEAGARGLTVVLTPVSFESGLDPAQPQTLRARFATRERLIGEPEGRALTGSYLRALLGHTNRYTGRRYADDPAVALIEPVAQLAIDFSISDDALVAGIDSLVQSVRDTGAGQPVVCQLGRRVAGVGRSRADVVSVNVYPSGLEAGRPATGDFLARLETDFGLHQAALKGKAKACLEFDAADTTTGYLYLATARALRAAGVQVACQFQYDSLAGAAYNNTWPSDWLNLIYTPQRAVALAAAAEAFRNTPRGIGTPTYPAGLVGRTWRIESSPDCVRWSGGSSFYHSNSVTEGPAEPEALRRIGGRGSSPVGGWDGLGSYWLERLQAGLWALRVYPDVVPVGNPFDLRRAARMARLRPVAQLSAAPHLLSLVLRDLGGTYWAWPVRPGGPGAVVGDRIPSRNGALLLSPGVYLVAGGARPPVPPEGFDAELHAPAVRAGQAPLLSGVWPRSASPHRPLALWVRAVGGDDLQVVLHVVRGGEDTLVPATASAVLARGTRDMDARTVALTTYTAFVPPALVSGDSLRCYWSAKDSTGTVTLPDAGANDPAHLPIGDRLPLTLCSFRFGALPPVRLADAPGQRLEVSGVGGPEPERGAMMVETSGFGEHGVWVCRVPVDPSGAEVEGYGSLRLRAWAVPAPGRLEISLLDDGNGLWATTVALAKDWSTVVVPLAKLVQQSGRKGPVPVDRITAVGLRSGAWLFPGEPDVRRLVIIDDVALVP